MRRSLLATGLVLAGALGSAPVLQAQGSSVMTHSSCTIALGGASVAAPCRDGSAVLFNPAGIALQPSTLGVGWTGITQDREFTFDFTGETIETTSETTSVPFGFATYRFNERLAAGFGVFAPYGLGIQWPLEFEGRFVTYDSELRNIYFQPTLAYQPTRWLSLGAGVDVVSASLEILQRIDLADTQLPPNLAPFPGATFGNFGVPQGTDFADARLEGDDTGFGFHLGAIARISDRISVGLRYLSEVDLDYEGRAEFEQLPTGAALPNPAGGIIPLDPILAAQFQPGAPLSAQSVTTDLTLPAQFVVGVAVRPIPSLRINADYQWTGWDSFDDAPITFETAPAQTLVLDYQNTDTWRVGGELRATDALALRAGFIYNTAAEKEFSVSPLLPEAERNYYTAGVGYRFGNGVGIDIGFQHIDQSDRRGRVRARPAGLDPGDPEDLAALQALNVGVYSVNANVLGVTLSYHFGQR